MTPWTVAHQAPLSMGFSKQEYWRGLPFSSPGDLPNPVIEPASPALAGRFFFFLPLSYQEAPKMSLNSESCPGVSDSLQLHGLYSPWNSPGQNTGGDFPTQGSNPGLPTLQMESWPVEPPGKPKNTGVDSLSLLQWIFLTQELNQNLLHCRQILYQLSYQR